MCVLRELLETRTDENGRKQALVAAIMWAALSIEMVENKRKAG
jgi:hypothetical protein